jgi:hypothetical protein
MTTVDINAVANNFVQFYYQTFTSNRAGLGALYQPHSMLSFEGQPFQGSQSIVEKLTVRLHIHTVTCQLESSRF